MNESKIVALTGAQFQLADWTSGSQATLTAGDIRQPWKSVYGFATTAARLAANQPLTLHSREDELFALVAGLNELVARPEVLNRAFEMLKKLEDETLQKLARLVQLEDQPVDINEAPDLIAQAEQWVNGTSPDNTADRLAEILAPDQPTAEIAGLRTMAARLQRLISALEAVKDQGFHVVVFDRRRQPARPAVEARRNEPIHRDGEPTALPAGFLQPLTYHATLWSYVVARSDRGQSTIWN